MARTRFISPFSVMLLTLIKQCSYVAVGFFAPAISTPAFATSMAARCLASRHSATNASLSFCVLSFRSAAVSFGDSSSSSAISPPFSDGRFINRRDFRDPSLGGNAERDLLFFVLPSLYSSSDDESSPSSSPPPSLLPRLCLPQAMSLDRRSSEMDINPKDRRRALFLSMFLARALSYSESAGCSPTALAEAVSAVMVSV
mmetsp:Transcript_19583/g.41943  ORF Transcript_19583/g.41943 Transcript_19583/m.41943 type:complete len:200 (-) Transcript_19583:37-636(-)